ncbi:hypothetical protein ABT288_39035, partial [Streptomyces sp. NPDC001093]|uniref:hypothetical protein n=1 Tax=Streptomyces sp. NPDC001093 TaxID=3154376 RepID=UPI003326D9B0
MHNYLARHDTCSARLRRCLGNPFCRQEVEHHGPLGAGRAAADRGHRRRARGPRPNDFRASAEVALDQDWFAGTDTAAELIAAAEREFPDGDWDTDFLRLRHSYARLLLIDGALRMGPEGKDPYALARLHDRARELHDAAPDELHRGWAAMYRGLIAENHYADRKAANGHYTAALRAGENGGDGLLAREALRHLGDQDRDAGDLERATERRRRATALGARAGTAPGTLSQQLLPA